MVLFFFSFNFISVFLFNCESFICNIFTLKFVGGGVVFSFFGVVSHVMELHTYCAMSHNAIHD